MVPVYYKQRREYPLGLVYCHLRYTFRDICFSASVTPEVWLAQYKIVRKVVKTINIINQFGDISWSRQHQNQIQMSPQNVTSMAPTNVANEESGNNKRTYLLLVVAEQTEIKVNIPKDF